MKNNVRKKQSISIVVPVLNEEGTINELIYRIKKSIDPKLYTYEIIFVDDRSTDSTAEVIQQYTSNAAIKYFIKLGEPGKAQALLEGFSYAKYELIGMIDSDLQYPPEAIPLMIEKMDNGYDVVIAERKEVHAGAVRKAFSRTFNHVFARLLHGIKFDVQSGLKVFRKEIIERINIRPFPWTFDLEFLLAAKSAGYKITGLDITFDKRKNGSSKVNLIKTSFQIGLSALLLKLKSADVVPFHKDRKDALGPGFHYKGIEFIHFSDLKVSESAVKTVMGNQLPVILSFIAILIIGLFINWQITITIFVAFITILYFIDLLFNFLLIYRSFTKSPEIKVEPSEFKDITEWPMYTIFCPLYREWVVVPQFVKAIENLDYPKDKLQVQLLLEEDDQETIEHVKEFNLPSYIQVIVVPHSLPKTKPKACNYGLRYATGEYAVIYDAEDIPDIFQLKKAVIAFRKSPNYIACIQAKLNYYNKSQNLLTRLFTAEYSLWFDLILTGLQSLGAPIPLGGTSNHFKVDKLREVKGWDSFNVTEDCDLGIRLSKKGYKTAIVDSLTMEEANSDFFNWINQRSRWIKGYMQTYLVHMRDPRQMFKNGAKAQFFTFQLVVGGKILSLFINPLMWFTTVLYFTLRATVGPTIEQFYPGPIFYMGVFSLIFGNFLYIYYYMIGCAKREQYDLIKYIFLVPFYWLAMSYAAWKGLIQLIFNPHYWPKTVHGLHLQKVETIATKTALGINIWHKLSFPKKFNSKFFRNLSKNQLSGGIFIISNAIASILSFVYSAYLGRVLTLEDFALIGLINGLVALITVIFGSLGTTISYRTGYLMGMYGPGAAISFWKRIRKSSLIFSLILTILWIITTPFLLSYFNLSKLTPLLLFSPILLVNLVGSADKGLLFSKFDFKALSILTIGEALIKLLIAFLLIIMSSPQLAYISIPLSVVLSFILGWHFVFKETQQSKTKDEKIYAFPIKFFIGSVILGFSSIIFLNLDVILAKHYLNSYDAGLYTLTALIGKMIFFLASLATPFTIPLVSRYEGANQDTRKILNLTVLGTLLLSIPAFLVIVLFGTYIIPLMFGAKAIETLPYITLIAFGMVCFSIAKVYTDYYLAKRFYSFPVIAIVLGLIQLIFLETFHSSILSFVYIMSSIWILYLVCSFILHLFAGQVKDFENAVVDFFGLFSNLEKKKDLAEGKISILVFNWRDTKHKWAGGAEVYLHELSKQWVKDGNQVTIFCGNSGKSPKNEVIDDIQIYRRGGFYMVYIWAFVYYIFKFRGRYDVIIDSENGLPFFTPLYAKEKKFLLIHHVHQEVFRKSLHWPFSTIASFLEGKVMPFVYRNTQIITVSPSSKKEILKYKFTTKEPIVIYNGVDLTLFKQGEKNKKPFILYLGRLQHYKSLDVFIKAAKKILEKVPDAEFVIAGEGEEKRNLQKLAEKLNITDKVTFLGYVTTEEKIKLFQKAWVFVNPSLMEGWGITTIEANACGTPTIASDVPGLRDSIKHSHTGLLVPYGDVDTFVQNIELIITNKTVHQKLSDTSIKWAKNFTWKESADIFFQLMTSQSKDYVKEIHYSLANKYE